MRGPNVARRVLQGAQGAQTEEVELDEPQLFHVILIELDNPDPFGGKLERREIEDRIAGDDQAAEVSAEELGVIGDLLAEIKELLQLRGGHAAIA